MKYRFEKHYTREEARALLPQVRQWLKQLSEARRRLDERDKRVGSLLAGGNDVGGEAVNQWVRTIADIKQTLLEFHRREIQIKDLDRGLIDFPAIIGGKEVFLCWEQGEEDIEFWHDLQSGYAGRERL
jgi:hypothetical protein